MSIAIAGATGNTGGRIAQQLIEAGADVTVLVRNSEKLSSLVRQNATVHQGSLEDIQFVIEATQAAEALYWVVPYNFGASNFRAYQHHVGNVAASAVKANQIPYVVNLSSNGAHLPQGMGPISGLYEVEQQLNAVAQNIVHLRPGFFMENYLMQLDPIRSANSVFLPIASDRRLAIIATQDIAAVAAELLLQRNWSGHSVLGLHGPTDLSFDEAAAILSQELGRSIVHVSITSEQFRAELLRIGASESVAADYVEMWQSLSHPEYSPAEPRTSQTTTPTTFSQFVREQLLPHLSQLIPA
ncbi:NmrA family NAD(P)-binding protein [Leptolyngbya sp. FACHB-711]|uniref:NmrA family NAD(P)-binding protein n=1 Tax=unclassified Leptolyngbya TaxID=2650499 RepID=UPI001683FB61|nr:NmrA family NAD(P)-binding protein [Leptolyngbya sp. FACHB-711]MBD1853937.1 NmrA family NAD(P)-binding protein [Cyanobacteria bacterium FACHB-502]MBD2022832.1 NmrA family NAD(P)-binding protein [Leptolyngbya sp. FACHB-711]